MKKKIKRNIDWEEIRFFLCTLFYIGVGGTFMMTVRVIDEGAIERAWPIILILSLVTMLFGVPYFILKKKAKQ